MRLSRWLILAAILAIVVFVGQTFIKRQQALARDKPAPPPPLETGIDGRASDWVYTQSDGEHPRVTVRAKSFRQVKAPSVMELNGVELQLFHKDGDQFDLVRSEKAQFDIAAKTLYSDGDVVITMGKPAGKPVADEAGGRIVTIHTSGVRFASDTGKATTDRKAKFEFEQGHGSAEGVDYDPNSRALHLRSKVELHWKAAAPRGKPMLIEAGEAYYNEAESKVFLLPWSKLTRDSLHMEGGGAQVTLDHGVIKEALAQAAHGVEDDPGRKVEFAADSLWLRFGDGTKIQEIKGQKNGKLVSTANAMRTTVTAEIIDLEFDSGAEESTLKHALAMQKAVAEAWKKATGCALSEGYGLSETSPTLTCNPADADAYSGTIGLPVPSTDISIRDDDGNEVPLGQSGEICAKGPQVMAGYWNRPEETANVMTADGYFRTGDIGVMTPDGYTKIVDRKKDMILVSGFNVYPNEIEDVIASHPGVLECAVIGVQDAKSGEAVKAFIVRKDPGITAEEIIKFCGTQLTNYKVPKQIEFRTDLPKTNVGKILRRELRDEKKAAAA